MIDIYSTQLQSQPYEAMVDYNGNNYHLVFGEHTSGWFLCIPNHRIGVELAHPADKFWNRESLSHAGISSNEANAIAGVLKELSKSI